MSSESSALTLLSRAQQALAAARTIDDFKDVRDLAEAAREYARRKKYAHDVLLDVACLTIRAEHALGTALLEMDLAKAVPGNQYTRKHPLHPGTGPKFLRDLGLSKQASHRAQLVAALPKEELERWLEDQCADRREPTLPAARRHAVDFTGRQGESRAAMGRGKHKVTTVDFCDEVTELVQHHKMLDRLLSRIYDGGMAEFQRAEGRLVRRLILECIELLRELAKSRRNR
jgi:hypothetical protein